MAKMYKGSLNLDWYNKQKAILLAGEESIKTSDIPAPRINWINKEEALFYEIDENEGRGLRPYWVDRNDIRIKEARPLIFQKGYKAVKKNKEGQLLREEWKIEEIQEDTEEIENILIKGDNLLALNTLKKIFDNKPDDERVKCIYIDPPYNTEQSFENYDDNLAHSEWLTMMRDRIILLKDLLREDGAFVIHIDEKEYAYLKILCDEIFGRENFLNSIAVRDSHPSGLKLAHKEKTIIKTKSIIAVYRKSEKLMINPVYQKRDEWDTHFNIFLSVEKEEIKKYSLAKVLEERKILNSEEKLNKESLKNEKFRKFCFENRENIFQSTKELPLNAKEESLKNKDKVYRYIASNGEINYAFNGRRLSPLSKSINDIGIDGYNQFDFSKLLCDFWDDIDFNNSQNEGGVSFPSSKKPEFLIGRLITMFSNKNDLILDSFLGSGTTASVSHKMDRKWIGIEQGKHADTHVVKRINSIIDGSDQSGVSKILNWQGGGSFKYYHLGESIITEDDFNWKLGKKFIQESFLSSYDYILDKEIKIENKLYEEQVMPSVGIQKIGNKTTVAIVALNTPEEHEMISQEEMSKMYKLVKEKYSPEYVNIFTNKGIEIAFDAKPEDLEIIKIPRAIFAELER